MSDVVSEMESQDVMSSVRRKVSNDTASEKNASSGVDKLVLTSSLRVDESNAGSAGAKQPDAADLPDSAEAANDQPGHKDDAQMKSPEAEPDTAATDQSADESQVDEGPVEEGPAEQVQAEDASDDAMDDRDILTAEPAGFAPGMMMDEDTLRDLISDIVRQELQGDLGEKITRNVRKLVRREIHRTMVSNELS